MKQEFICMDACHLSRLIETTYGREYNIAYMVMEDQRKITMSCGKTDGDAESAARVAHWAATGEETMTTDIPNCGYSPILEYLMCDLCNKGLLEEGDYLLEFDD